MLIAACGRDLPARADAPADGDLEIGVAYAAEVRCAVPFELGGRWWAFEEGATDDWPADITMPPWPFSLWANVTTPHAVPGIVTLTSPTEAVFRADVDGSERPLTVVDGEDGACL